ncbi:MAG: hypothetical protein JSW18_02730, partial [Candidatus Omnitrophota bacterium]
NRFFGPYAQKVWGIEPSLLNADDIIRRVTTINLWDVIRKALRGYLLGKPERKGSYPQQPQQFYYGAKGAGTVMQIIAGQIRKLGGIINIDSAVVQMNIKQGKIQDVVVQDNKGKNFKRQADFFVSTMPITSLIKIIHPLPREEIAREAAPLQFRALILVDLKVKKERVFNAQWIYFSDKKFIFNRINEFKNISPDFAPNKKTGLTLEVTCFANDETWNLADKEIYFKTMEDFKKLGLIEDSDIEGYTIRRLEFAYPVPRIDTKDSLNSVLEHLSRIKNLFLAGREARFEYINMDECLDQGFRLVKEIKSMANLKEA